MKYLLSNWALLLIICKHKTMEMTSYFDWASGRWLSLEIFNFPKAFLGNPKNDFALCQHLIGFVLFCFPEKENLQEN